MSYPHDGSGRDDSNVIPLRRYSAMPYPEQPYGVPAADSPFPAGPGHPARPPQSPAGGATAITAGVLGLIVGLLYALAGSAEVVAILADDSLTTGRYRGFTLILLGLSVIGAVVGLLWVLGAVLLFRRKTAGRVLLIVMGSADIVVCLALASFMASAGLDLGAAAIGLTVAVPVVVLAAIPPTGRWIADGKRRFESARFDYPNR